MIAISDCVGWLMNYVSSVGEHLPNENRIELPAGTRLF